MGRKGENSGVTTVTLAITRAAQESLEEVVAASGMSKKEVVSRLICWFAAQDATDRAAIMQHINPEDAPIAALLTLARWNAHDELRKRLDEAAVLADLLRGLRRTAPESGDPAA